MVGAEQEHVLPRLHGCFDATGLVTAAGDGVATGRDDGTVEVCHDGCSMLEGKGRGRVASAPSSRSRSGSGPEGPDGAEVQITLNLVRSSRRDILRDLLRREPNHQHHVHGAAEIHGRDLGLVDFVPVELPRLAILAAPGRLALPVPLHATDAHRVDLRAGRFDFHLRHERHTSILQTFGASRRSRCPRTRNVRD